jgi:mono/diheme cytochrome c family protein
MMLARACVGAFVGLCLASAASADIVREVPWHPIAYAYRSGIFLLNLQPIDWDLVERKLTTDDGGRLVGRPAAERIRELDRAGGTRHWPAIEQALADRDAQTFYAASTRAVARAIRHHLAQAAARLDRPGEARRELKEAEQLYRSFADFIQEADPERHPELGLAWLELSSRLAGAAPAAAGTDPTFLAAQATIEDYLRANYEPAEFAPRQSFAPVPEQRLRAEPGLQTTPWRPPGSDLNDQDPLPRLVLNFEEQGIDERDLFLVAFGDMLFDSPEIFGEPAKSLGLACSTCHNRSDINQRLFIPGITPKPGVIDVDGAFFNGRFNDHRPDAVDIPSLRGIRFTAPYGRDGRLASLRDFVRNVIVNEFAGEEPAPLVLDALVAYMLEFDFLPAPYLDFDGTLNETASEAARRGEALFNRPFAQMAGRSCASCHIPDSFFTDNRAHNIGSGGESYAGALDGAYDTPTLLGIVHTAPYFHDGSVESLADVVAWFDDHFELALSEEGRADLTAYLEAVGTGEEPYERFDAENTPFRLMADELSTFLSTLGTLIPARDGASADLLLRTVAGDLALDASAMTNRAAIERVHEMVARLEELRAAIAAGRWADAEKLWSAYQELERQYAMEMY